MITFGLTSVIGFASIKDEIFDWGISGLNIIQAPNGSGKTKFINALYWGLYGKTLSGSVLTWDHIRGKDYPGVMVEVNFKRDNDEVRIIRCKDYTLKVEGAKGKNRLIVLVNGKEPEVKDKKDIQKFIEELVGYSPDLFKNSIIFGQKLKRLITESGPNKKKVFDEAFEIAYLAKAREINEKERVKHQESFDAQSHKVDALSKDLKNLEDKLESELGMVNNFENNRKASIDEQESFILKNSEKLESLSQDYAAIDLNTYEALPEAKEKLEGLGDEGKVSKLVGKLEFQIEAAEKEKNRLYRLSENIPTLCPHCGRDYDPNDRIAEEKKLRKDYLHKSGELVQLQGSLKEQNRLLSSILKAKKEVTHLEANLKELEKLSAEMASLEKDTESRKNSIKSLKEQVLKNNCDKLTRDIRLVKADLEQELSILRVIHKRLKIKEWLTNDPLSNKGLKAYIFETMLEKLNEKLLEYSQYIGFQVMFDIDMDSHNKDLITYVYNGTNIVPYDDLSGGQQQSVDVVSAFAIHDIVNEGRECNLLIMDEIFESLDKRNIDIVTELIQDKAKNKCLYLITHLDNFNPINANLIKVYLEDGVTRIAK